MRINDDKCDALRTLLDCHGQDLNLPAAIRVMVISLAINDYKAEAASFAECLAEGITTLNGIHRSHTILEDGK